jgi:hypothetical protein
MMAIAPPEARAQARAQPEETSAEAGEQTAGSWFTRHDSRLLGGHRYIPPMLQRSAFVLMHFGVRQGFELFIVPDVALDFGKDDLRAAGFAQTFDLDVKLTQFLGLYASGTGTVTSGVNAASAFEIGADLEGAVELGAVLRIARFEPIGTQIALRFSGGIAFENDYNVSQFIEAGRQSSVSQITSIRQSQALALLITPSKASNFGASLHIAQTLIEQVGLQASLGVRSIHRRSEPFDLAKNARLDETVDEVVVDAAFALSFDASSWGVPLALMPEYQVVHDAVRSEDDAGTKRDLTYSSHFAGIGLYYSGRPNLILGVGGQVALNLEQDRLEWNATDGSPRTSGTPSKRQGHFVLGYVW